MFAIGTRIVREMTSHSKHFGVVVAIGTGPKEGRFQIAWSRGEYIPMQWDGVVRRRIRNVPTGEPVKTYSLENSPRTWIAAKFLKRV